MLQWAGSFAYTTGTLGGTFWLDWWLEDRNDESNWNTVNCYDQAGILQCALSLGVPKRRLSWEYKKPFGYITARDLVGWGRVNNVSLSLHSPSAFWYL